MDTIDAIGEFGGSGGLVIGLAAVAGLLLTWGVGAAVATWRDPVRRRLASVGNAHAQPVASDSLRQRLMSAAGPLGALLAPGEGKERGRIDRLLFEAGYRGSGAATQFFGVKAALAVLLPLAWLAAARYLPTLTTRQVLFIAGVAVFVGMVAPNRWLERRVEKRQRKLRNGFPDALDLLVICVEAGLGLAAAIERVAEELRFSHPELAQELALVNVEMRAGVERETALRNLADRTGLKDIRGLVSLMIQTLRFGTSVADTLRVFSEEFRDQRMQAAEENAAKMGTKLIFPLILCMFPSFFVIAVGPAAIRLAEAFSK